MTQKDNITQITPETLSEAGFTYVVKENNIQYFKKGEIRVIHTGIQWQLCDINGNVGNSYVNSIEEIFDEASR